MLPADSPFASPAAPGPHPATAELRAYAAGTLPAADEHRIEAHTLDCERCAELLDGFSMSDAATTDHALAELRTRLQARVGHDLTEPVPLPASRPLWPRVAAAVALLGAVGAGIWGWEQQPAQAPAVATTTVPAAAPAAETPPAAPPAATDASTARAATQQPTAVATPATAPAPSRPAEYAANRPASPRSLRRPALRPPAPATAILADQADTPAAADGWAATATSPPPGQVAAAPAAAASVAEAAADESEAKEVLVAAPARAKKASPVSATDSSVASPQLAVTSRFSIKAKAAESAALVRVTDKPMPTVPTIAPAPVSGTPALRNYLFREAAKFEPAEGERRLNGSVRLRFIVGADGKLNNLQVVRSLRADYDEEALRLVCEGPAWRPGIANGRRADLPMEVTVTF